MILRRRDSIIVAAGDMIVSFFAFLCAHFKSDEGKPVKRYRDGSCATLPDSAEGGGEGLNRGIN